MPDHRPILHLYHHASATVKKFVATLEDYEIPSCQVSDVYTAMAHIVHESPSAYRMVLVDLGSLKSAQREFFQLLHHRFRSLPVYVYRPEPCDMTVEEALQSGARGRVDPDTLLDILCSPTVTTAATPQRPAVDSSSPARLTDLLVNELVRPLEQTSSVRVGLEVPDEDSAFRGEEIQSRRQDSSSKRQKPKSKVAPQVRSEETTADGQTASLLTPDELEALLGDDPETVHD